MATPALAAAVPVTPVKDHPEVSQTESTEPKHRGGSLIAGCAVAMLSTVVASSVPGPASLAILAAGFLGGAAVAVKFA